MEYTIVLGGGESGMWAALLAKREGHRVLLSDSGTLNSDTRASLSAMDIEIEERGHVLPDLEHATRVIKSPGIPDSALVIRRCLETGVPVISEIEFAARYAGDSTLVAITGSNGKTTTTILVASLLRAAGVNAIACGNIGTSLAQCVVRDPHPVYVIELSSFQLDHMYATRAHVALLLNITPDHLDRYDHKLSNYADAKGRVFLNQTTSDFAIFNADDPITKDLLLRQTTNPARALTFSLLDSTATAYYADGTIHLHLSEAQTVQYDYTSMKLKGEHNAANIMAACLALHAMGCDSALVDGTIETALRDFAGIEHRMEPSGVWHEITFINDSKATNIDSTHYALGAMPEGKTVLILGGTDKGNDYSVLLPQVVSVAKALIYLTKDNRKLHETFDSTRIPSYDCYSMEDAFATIRQLPLEAGDIVLLSPACASFDLFRNYEHRGHVFKEQVQQLLSQE